MRVYHGSYLTVDAPKIINPNRPLDFGKGFYLTSLQHQADRWAIAKPKIKRSQAIVSIYKLDIEQVKQHYNVKVFNFANEEWLDMVKACRKDKDYTPTYDVIIGEVMKLNYNILHRLVSMCIKEMIRLANLSVEDAFNIFYQSETARLLEDEEAPYFTYSPTALAYVCLEEKGLIQIEN